MPEQGRARRRQEAHAPPADPDQEPAVTAGAVEAAADADAVAERPPESAAAAARVDPALAVTRRGRGHEQRPAAVREGRAHGADAALDAVAVRVAGTADQPGQP